MKRSVNTLTIAINTTASDSVQLQASLPAMLLMPSTFTGTSILFEVSVDGGSTWRRLYWGGADYSVPVLANKAVPVNGAIFLGADSVRLVSNATELGERLVLLVLEGDN
jgi:hypothetical protein